MDDAHEQWVKDWEEQFLQLQDGDMQIVNSLVRKHVRITTEQGASTDHPGSTVVVTGTVLGFGQDHLFSLENPKKRVSRTSLVLDNGHAHFIKPGMVFEVRDDDDHGTWFKVKVATDPT